MDGDEDPYKELLEECIISSSQEEKLSKGAFYIREGEPNWLEISTSEDDEPTNNNNNTGSSKQPTAVDPQMDMNGGDETEEDCTVNTVDLADDIEKGFDVLAQHGDKAESSRRGFVEIAGSSVTAESPLKMAKVSNEQNLGSCGEKENAQGMASILYVLREIAQKKDAESEEISGKKRKRVSIFDTAVSVGYTFPRPSWWPEEGFPKPDNDE